MGVHKQGIGRFAVAGLRASLLYVEDVTGDLHGLVLKEFTFYGFSADQVLQGNSIVEILLGGKIEPVLQGVQVIFLRPFFGCAVKTAGLTIYIQIAEILLRIGEQAPTGYKE